MRISLVRMTDIKSLEHPTLKVPYEILNKKFRSAQKVLDREVSHVTSSLGEVDRVLGEVVDRVAITQQLDNIKEQLVQLKSKGGESIIEETRIAEVGQNLTVHLPEIVSLGYQEESSSSQARMCGGPEPSAGEAVEEGKVGQDAGGVFPEAGLLHNSY